VKPHKPACPSDSPLSGGHYFEELEMNNDDAYTYWWPVVEKLLGVYQLREGGQCTEFQRILGTNEYTKYLRRSTLDDYPMHEDLKQLLIKLAGPHGDTLYKVLKIRAEQNKPL
jgi:hypothetical protein